MNNQRVLHFKGLNNAILILIISFFIPLSLFLIFHSTIEIPNIITSLLVENIPSLNETRNTILNNNQQNNYKTNLEEIIRIASFALLIAFVTFIPLFISFLIVLKKIYKNNTPYKYPNNFFISKSNILRRTTILIITFTIITVAFSNVVFFDTYALIKGKYVFFAISCYSLVFFIGIIMLIYSIRIIIKSEVNILDVDGEVK